MSVAYFPSLYPDELVYSVLTRAYMHGGYVCVHHAEEEFFVNPKIRIEKEFIKNLKPEIVKLMTREKSLEELIEKHTMYPFYGRFISKDRRKSAFRALMEMEGDFSKLFGIPNLPKGEKRYLKFCPLCTKENRKALGEDYWCRYHQMRGINVCYKHGCYLYDSTVSLDSKVSVKLITAEEVVDENREVIFCQNKVELELARYMVEVFSMPIKVDSESNIGRFLHIKMAGTEYLSCRGERIFIKKLWKDMKRCYQGMAVIEDITTEQIQSVFRGKRTVYQEICMIAMFLSIAPKELVEMKTPIESLEQQFDRKVLDCLASGISMKQVADDFGVSLSIISKVKEIASKDVKNDIRRKQNAIIFDWDSMDAETLPVVQEAINNILNNYMDRPKKISLCSIAKYIDIPVYHLQKMNKCRRAVELSRESDERYHARKVKWAFYVLKQQELPIKMWRISAITKLEKEDVEKCLPELKKIVDIENVLHLERDLKQVVEPKTYYTAEREATFSKEVQ